MSDQQVDDLISAYQAGSSCHELAERFGINQSTVSVHLKRRGVPKRPYRKLHGEQLDQARHLYATGTALTSVAARLGLCREAVRSGLLASGVVLRPSR